MAKVTRETKIITVKIEGMGGERRDEYLEAYREGKLARERLRRDLRRKLGR